MLERQVTLARRIACFILRHHGYELLPKLELAEMQRLRHIYIIVLFRALDDKLNGDLVKRINAAKKIYVSETVWNGVPACRFAVSNWQVDPERDFLLVTEVLEAIAMEASQA